MRSREVVLKVIRHDQQSLRRQATERYLRTRKRLNRRSRRPHIRFALLISLILFLTSLLALIASQQRAAHL